MTDELQQYVDDVARALEALEAGDHDEYGDAYDWLADRLEVVGQYERSIGYDDGPRLVGVEVLVTYGGPTVRVGFDAAAYAAVGGTWGADARTASAYCPTVAAAVLDVVDAYGSPS